MLYKRSHDDCVLGGLEQDLASISQHHLGDDEMIGYDKSMNDKRRNQLLILGELKHSLAAF